MWRKKLKNVGENVGAGASLIGVGFFLLLWGLSIVAVLALPIAVIVYIIKHW